jgi:hypothetical protein
MKNNDTYSVTDLDGYATILRESAAKNISSNCGENLDSFITNEQAISLVHEYCIGYDEDNNPIIDEETHYYIVDNIETWIENSGLAKLAANDILECAWNNDSNTMIFWHKNNVSTNTKT